MRRLALRIACTTMLVVGVGVTANADPITSMSGIYSGPTGPTPPGGVNSVTFDSGSIIQAQAFPAAAFNPGWSVSDLTLTQNGLGSANLSATLLITDGVGPVSYAIASPVALIGLPNAVFFATTLTGLLNNSGTEFLVNYDIVFTGNGLTQLPGGNFDVPGTSTGSFTISATPNPVPFPPETIPEPASIAIWAVLVLAVGCWIWRRKIVLSRKEVCVST